MKKAIAILLVMLISISTFSFLSTAPKVQSTDQWPDFDVTGDGKVNLDDTIKYVKDHYSSYNPETGEYLWDYSDPYDTAMADYFMQSVLYVESIRDSNNDQSLAAAVSKLISITAGGLMVNNFDGTQCTLNDQRSCAIFAVKNFLANVDLWTKELEPIFATGKLVDFLSSSGLTSVEIGLLKTELIAFLVDKGEAWLVQIETTETYLTLKFDTADSPSTSMLGKVAGFFRLIMKLADFLTVLMEHIVNIVQIGKASLMETVKSHEMGVEAIRGLIEIVGKLIKEFVGKPLESAYAKGLITVCATLAVAGGPPGLVAAAVVGVAGVAFYFAVDDIVDEGIEWLADETLGLDLAIYKRLASSPNAVYIPLYQVEVRGINTGDEDNYIPWGPGYQGEDVFVVVRNSGVRTLDLRVEPEITSVDLATGKTGWSIDDKQLDLDNWIEKQDLRPGEYSWTDFRFHVDSGTIVHHFPWPFSDVNDEWLPGENPATINFKFNHDVETDWWDFFDIFKGLKYLGSQDADFYNSVDIMMTVHGGIHITHGETASRTIDVKNLKAGTITFVPVVHLRDPLGKSNVYDSQLVVTPSELAIDPQETRSFTVEWTAPNDAPVGFYSLEIDGKDREGHRYVDNVQSRTIFYLYKLNIIFPTSTNPARAGDPENPNTIYAYVTGLPPLQDDPAFFVRVGSGGAIAEYEIVDTLPVPAGYTLKLAPPIMGSEGKYDLDIWAIWGEGVQLGSEDIEPKAVEYASGPSVEPIEKGLAYLRTSQLADGSWRSSVGATALCVLSFLNAGYDETDTKVNHAMQYILSKVKADGSIWVASGSKEYETSLATLALVATHNVLHQSQIDNARNWIVNSQWDESCYWGSTNKAGSSYGGFGYGYSTRADMSNTQFALLALDAAGLPKSDSTWAKAQVFLHRCQKVNFDITVNIDGTPYPAQHWNYAGSTGGYDGGFVYFPGTNAYVSGAPSMGAMTGAGIWGLLLSGVPKNDQRVTEAINWVVNHYTWDTNPNSAGYRRYYYYLSMSKALTMYGEKIIGGHDWYQDLYNKLMNPSEMIAVGTDKVKWVPLTQEDLVPDLSTAYAILSMQTRSAAPTVQRLSYLNFILRSNCLIRIVDPDGNLVGYNYMIHIGENNVLTAVYSGPFSEPQYIVIVNPKPGTYKLELVGTSEGPYTLNIQGNYGEEVTKRFEYTGEINPGELYGSTVTVTAIVGPIDIYANPPQFEGIIIDRSSLTYTGATIGPYSDPVELSATLEDLETNSPISGKTVSFTIGTQTATGTTNASGIATASITLIQPSGSYTVTASFAGDSTYQSSSDSRPFTINKENVAITYTGDTLVFTAGPTISTAPVHLVAHLVQESDGHPGDLTLASVTFALFKSSNFGSTPDLIYDASVNSAGDAHYDVASLAADVWTVRVTIKSGNLYWTQTSEGLGILVVSLPGLSATGGGWIPDSSSANGKDNFGFTLKYNKNQAPKGNFVFVFRGKDGYDYVVKSNSWQGGGLSFTGTNKAYFSGKCNVQKIDRTTGAVVASWGDYKFAVDITDGDLTVPQTADSIAVRILNSANAVWRQIGTSTAQIPLGGGNIVVHSR